LWITMSVASFIPENYTSDKVRIPTKWMRKHRD
jgi:hypothetical protein